MSILKKNPPSAKILMNSMRSMGYTFESALADIVDNSISADAKNINIIFPTDPNECYVAIYDDGNGMNDNSLYEAMKYGSNINEYREENDLGRFGLGLKSASLSQCKKLTVASKTANIICGYIWDLDKVDEDWIIQECEKDEIENIPQINLLKNSNQGTLVVWQNFDVIEKSTGNVFSYLNEEIDFVGNYLSLIFHRYLNDDKGNKINIKINEFQLVGLDPFLEKHIKTNHRKEISIPILDSNGVERSIVVKPFVLPFQKDISSEDKNKIGGVESYNTKQGFYVYRNKRLIIWGTWFRMKPKHELTKNARIRVDIPNTLDDIWGIDIKKQNASLPKMIKTQLVKAVEEAMSLSIKAQRFRGRINNIDDSIDYIWNRVEGRNTRYKYKINRDSKIFDFIKNIDEESRSRLELVLDEIEENIPYQQIYLDMIDHIVEDKEDDERKAEVKNKAEMLVEMACKMGQPYEIALNILFKSEPFCKFEDIKSQILEAKHD